MLPRHVNFEVPLSDKKRLPHRVKTVGQALFCDLQLFMTFKKASPGQVLLDLRHVVLPESLRRPTTGHPQLGHIG